MAAAIAGLTFGSLFGLLSWWLGLDAAGGAVIAGLAGGVVFGLFNYFGDRYRNAKSRKLGDRHDATANRGREATTPKPVHSQRTPSPVCSTNGVLCEHLPRPSPLWP